MREILFRGKAANRIENFEYRTRYKNGDWVYGLLTDYENYAGFAEMTNTGGISGIEVDKETIGQYTGLKDKNGQAIFEGDIVRYYGTYNLEIYIESGHTKIRWVDTVTNRTETDLFFGYDEEAYGECEIIGNIYDNPELLK